MGNQYWDSGDSGESNELSATELVTQMAVLNKLNPYMAENPEATMAMLTSGQPFVKVASQAKAIYGMKVGAQFAGQLVKMPPATQRSLFDALPVSQQLALQQMGYARPVAPEKGLIDSITDPLGPIGDVISDGLHLIGGAVTTVGTPVLHGLESLANWPGHLYRTVRSMDDTSQWAGLIGGLVTAAGIAFAPVTFGASLGVAGGTLATLGAAGMGGLIGANAAAALVGPGDWSEAFSSTWDGERSFDRPSQNRARELLGDPRLITLAKEYAHESIDTYELAAEMASGGSQSEPQQISRLQRVAEKYGEIGSAEYEQAYAAMTKLIGDPTFQQAVQSLVRGKMSPGRDIADAVGLDTNSSLYTVVSGAVDFGFTIGVDPLLLLGVANKGYKAATRGIKFADSAQGIERAKSLYLNHEGINRLWNEVAGAVDVGDFTRIERNAPTWKDGFGPLMEHVRNQRQAGKMTTFTGDDLLEFVTGTNQMKMLMSGIGTQRGSAGLVLSQMRRHPLELNRLGIAMRAVATGMTDPRTEKAMREAMSQPGMDKLLKDSPINQLFNRFDDVDGLDDLRRYHQLNVPAYETGRFLGEIPGIGRLAYRTGRFLEGVTTMSAKSKAIPLTGTGFEDQVRAATEMGRYMGMPSYVRRQWADTIIAAPNTGARTELMSGYLDDALTSAGLNMTEKGAALQDIFVKRSRHIYGAGDSDGLVVRGNRVRLGIFAEDQAQMMMMPNMREVKKAIDHNLLGQMMGVIDNDTLTGAVSRFWKPAVLMRIGFIPRAAGEEFLNFLLRGGIGGLAQEFGARSVGHHRAWKAAVETQQAHINAGGRFLNDAERFLLAQGPLVSHVRPVERMLRHSKNHDALVDKMQGYSDWIRNTIDDGIIKGVDPDAAIGKWFGVDGALKHADQPFFNKMNFAVNVKSVLLGNPHSWRRMALGGVDDHLIEASQKFYAIHGATLMREVSAIDAGAYDRGFNKNDLMSYLERAEDGTMQRVEYVVLRGQFQRYARNSELDGFYMRATHAQAVKPADDPFTQRVLAESMYRVGPGDWAHEDLADMYATYRQLGENGYDPGFLLVNEYIGRDLDVASFNVALDGFAKRSEVGSTLRASLPRNEVPTFDELTRTIRDIERRIDQPGEWDIGKKMSRMQPWINRLNDSTQQSRGFASQFLRGAHHNQLSVAGVRENRLIHIGPDSAAPASDEPLFFASMNEYEPYLQARLEASALDPSNQHFLQESMRLRSTESSDPMLSGTVQLYAAPVFHLGAAKKAVTVDEVARFSNDAQLISENRAAVQAILDAPAGRANSLLVDNKQLAHELDIAHARIYSGTELGDESRVMTTTVLEGILDGRRQGYLTPIHAETVGRRDVPRVWMTPTETVRLRPLDATVEDAVREHAAIIAGRLRQVWTPGTVEQLRPRVRKITQKSDSPFVKSTYKERPTVYEYITNEAAPGGKELRAVGPDERLVQGTQYRDFEGKPIDFGNDAYFESKSVATSEAGEIMWPLVGPIMEDLYDSVGGISRYAPRTMAIKKHGKTTVETDLVRVTRTQRSHIDPDLMPNFAIGEMFKIPKKNKWDDFVRWGFDRVIGPSIDSLARRPMAFHFYQQRYAQNMKLRDWLRDPEIAAQLDNLIGTRLFLNADEAAEAGLTAKALRRIATADGMTEAATWTDAATLAWMRATPDNELQSMFRSVHERAKGTYVVRGRKLASTEMRQLEIDTTRLMRKDLTYLNTAIPETMTSGDLLAYLRAEIKDDELLADTDRLVGLIWGKRRTDLQAAVMSHPVLSKFTRDDWKVLTAAHKNWMHVTEEVGELAAVGAIRDMMPFIDSHEIRSQFADYGSSFLPFWYAEENFLKRWGRTLVDEGPAAIRKAQLGYMGMKHVGVVRTDSEGNDMFVYPGSGLLVDTISALWPGKEALPIGVMFQAPTDSMLPGMTGDAMRLGAPAFSPLVTVPMTFLTGYVPELKPLHKALVGESAVDITPLEQLIPASLRNTYMAALATDSNPRFASAMMSAIAQLDATGKGLSPDATVAERQVFMDRVRDHARIIMVARAIGGFVAPGAPSPIVTGESAILDPLGGLGVEAPQEVFAGEYQALIRSMGIEKGTLHYLEINKDATLFDIVNPTAFTVGKSTTKGGAPIPSTQDAVDFYDANADYFTELGSAGPWLLPQDPFGKGERSQYAYDQQTRAGLRGRRTPEEFLTALLYKQGAAPYFAERDRVLKEIDKLRLIGGDDQARVVQAQWDVWAAGYKFAHPIFATELEGGDGRERRALTIREMRVVVDDVEAPANVAHMDQLRYMMRNYDQYLIVLADAKSDRSTAGQTRVEMIKKQWDTAMTQYAKAHPSIAAFWTTILRPESSLG